MGTGNKHYLTGTKYSWFTKTSLDPISACLLDIIFYTKVSFHICIFYGYLISFRCLSSLRQGHTQLAQSRLLSYPHIQRLSQSVGAHQRINGFWPFRRQSFAFGFQFTHTRTYYNLVTVMKHVQYNQHFRGSCGNC